MKLYIADAFTETLFGGNPAGVVLLENGNDFPPDEIMKKTAAELRYSETAFIKQLGKDEFQIRYFTPAAEVDLCGHATIASFACLMDAGLAKSGKRYTNHTLAGQLQIEIQDGLVMMDMAPPKHIATIDDAPALRELYETMGLPYAPDEAAPDEMAGISGRADCPGRSGTAAKTGCFGQAKSAVRAGNLIPMIISAGLADIIMPVPNRSALTAIAPDFERLSELSKKYEVVGVHAFTLESNMPGITAHCRNFAPLYGIDEEAATGTSSGALAYYLYKAGLLENSTVSFIQGEAMGRPSKILASIKAAERSSKTCGCASEPANVCGTGRMGCGSTGGGFDECSIVGDSFDSGDSEACGAGRDFADSDKNCGQTGKNDASICGDSRTGNECADAPEIRIQTGGKAAILAKGEIMLSLPNIS